ncbi:hypothetical protein FD755_025523, partial [Muntiacus reevesi]
GEVSAFWDFKACPPSRGGAPQRCGETAQAGEGRAWGNAKRGTKSRLNVAVDHQWPPSESPARLLISPKDGGHVKLNRPEDPGNTPRRSNVQGRENLLNVPGTCLSSAPRGLISCALGDGEQPAQLPGSSSNISYCSSSTGSGLRPTPRRKGVQEKKSLGGVSKPALGRTFPSWGQRISATPLEPATFPAISGIPLLGRSKKYALVPWEAEESKHTVAGKKPVARRAQESVAVMVVSGEDNDPSRDSFPKGQLTTDRPWPSSPWVHHGEPSSTNLNIRGTQDSGNSEPVAMNKGEVRPRGPGPSGDQEPTDHSPRLKRQPQPPGRQGCPRCLVLQREIDDLKEQLASKWYLAEKFQIV